MSIALKKLNEYDSELTALKQIMYLLEWDQSTVMPKKGIEGRSLQLSILSRRHHEMLVSSDFVQSVNALSKKNVMESLKPLERDKVRRYQRAIERRIRVPSSHVVEFAKLTSEAQHKWEIAKKSSDYSIFKPYLKRIIEMKRKEANYINPSVHPYEVLLDEYEEGMKIERVREEFSKLEEGLKGIRRRISNSKKNMIVQEQYKKIIKTKMPQEDLRKINTDIANMILEDKERYNFFESEHPFTASIGHDDARITTSYNGLLFSMGATIHEAGHALYELSFDKKIRGTILADAPSLGLHESQSRYWENHVGATIQFWKKNYGLIRKYMEGMGVNDFYSGMNHSQPNLIRVKSDEVTYPLHIIIRFQIELGLIEGTISVNELPRIWNDKYKELIGATPRNDSEGLLQDVHWSMGAIGYFPTYAIGTMYSAILDDKMRGQIEGYDSLIGNNDFLQIKDWLKRNIHVHGSRYNAEDIIFKATGSRLQSDTLISYLEKKYGGIYGFS
jgi:carboxypeptidase Taq